MSMTTLSKIKQTNRTDELLSSLKENQITHLNEYLLFDLDGKMQTELLQHIDFLKDDTLWTKEDLTSYRVVARTIDNDLILSNDTHVLIIPSSLNKKDSEIFSLSIWELLVQFEEKKLNTNILALY